MQLVCTHCGERYPLSTSGGICPRCPELSAEQLLETAHISSEANQERAEDSWWWRRILGWLLFIPGTALLFFTGIMGQNGGELALIPSVLCFLVGAAVVKSRSIWATGFSVAVACLLLWLMLMLSHTCVICK